VGTHPAGADQAVGVIEGHFQGEPERYGCANAQGEKESG
jgi:hypothetical protein